MPLWGATTADESKPKNLTTAQKKQVYAKTGGWVAEPALSGNGNVNATPEVLVAIRNLSVKLGSATISNIEWITTVVDKSAGFTLSIRVRYNEAVDVAVDKPTISVTNGNEGASDGRGPHLLECAIGADSNELVFSLVIGAANAATNEDDVLSVVAQSVLMVNSSTIKDAGTSTTSDLVITAAQALACGTLTVVA